MTNVKGKWALVTGASRGLGKLSALRCRTDLGGQSAPNAPESALPDLVLGIFADDKKSGRIFRAQEYAGKRLEDIL